METLNLLNWMFDLFLGVGLLYLAWATLAATDLFKAIVLFITFGLLMSIAWVRLNAIDIALAEAAIGAGLTGALLLSALSKIQHNEGKPLSSSPDDKQARISISLSFIIISILLVLTVGLGWSILSFPMNAPGLSLEVSQQLENSGVVNPVTAVLLNFRAYDTLLEMMVLLIAVLGVWSQGNKDMLLATEPAPVLEIFTRILTPVLFLVAFYLLWVGAFSPGGAFQAGAILGATGVLLVLSNWHLQSGLLHFPLRLILITGAATFLGVAITTLLVEGQLLKYPPGSAALSILILEITATLSIGVTLAALFIGKQPGSNEDCE